MMRFAGVLDNLKKVNQGMRDAYGEGREDHRIAFKRTRDDAGKDVDAVRIKQMGGTNRTLTMIMEALKANPKQSEVLRQMDMSLSEDPATRFGQVLGHIGADLTQDRSREAWWLINAPQALGNVFQELATEGATKGAFEKASKALDEAGNPLVMSNPDTAVRMGAMDAKSGRLKKGYSMKEEDGEKYIYKRDYEPGNVNSLQIPVGLAINSGIGLMNPFGGQEGYEAAVPDPEDRNKTSNVMAEIGTKYILGRTGNLLPWSEFKEVRPDVSKDEYMRYKAFKFDKDVDMNPFDDGKMSLPAGVARYTSDGIHGAEVQFLGRSIPLNTGILPTITAIAGTALGSRYGLKRKFGTDKVRPIEAGFISGMSGAVGGMAVGNALEQERRRRNTAANELDNINEEGVQLKS